MSSKYAGISTGLDYLNRILIGLSSGIVMYFLTYMATLNLQFSLAALGLVTILSAFSPFAIGVLGTGTVLTIFLYTFLATVSRAQGVPGSVYSLLTDTVILLIFSFAIPIYLYVKSKTTGYLLAGFGAFLGTVAILLRDLVAMIINLNLNLSNLIPTAYLSYFQLLSSYTPWWLALSLAGFGQIIRNESAYFKAVALTPLAYVPLIIVARSVQVSPLPFYLLIGGVVLSYATLVLVNSKSSYTRIVGGVTEIVSSVVYGFGLYLSGIVAQASIFAVGGIIGFAEVISLEIYANLVALVQQKRMVTEERTATLERIRATAEKIEAIQNALTLSTYTSSQEKIIDYLEKAKSETESLANDLLKCKPDNVYCIRNISNRLETIRKDVEVEVNNYLFNLISENNTVVNILKKFGILINPIEQNKSDVMFDQLPGYAKTVTESVLRNMNIVSTVIKNMNTKLHETLGTDLGTRPLLGVNLKNVISLIDERKLKEIDEQLDRCLNSGRALTDIISDSKTKVETATQLSQVSVLPISYEKVINSHAAITKLVNALKSDLVKMKKSLEDLATVMNTEQMKTRLDAVNETIKVLNSQKPMCTVLNEAFVYLPELLDAYQLVRNKDSIMSLAQLIDVIMPTLEAKEYVNISELGISQDFVPYVLEMMWSKGKRARVEKDKIVLREY